MAEENGILALKAPAELLEKLESLTGSDVTSVLAELFEYAGVESKAYQRETYVFDEAIVAGEYLIIKYDCNCCEWSYIADALVNNGSGIEFYASCNCYDARALEYYALDKAGKKIIFSLPLENSYEIVQEDDGFIERVTEKTEQWKLMIPEQVKNITPNFSDVKLDEFLMYCR